MAPGGRGVGVVEMLSKRVFGRSGIWVGASPGWPGMVICDGIVEAVEGEPGPSWAWFTWAIAVGPGPAVVVGCGEAGVR